MLQEHHEGGLEHRRSYLGALSDGMLVERAMELQSLTQCGHVYPLVPVP